MGNSSMFSNVKVGDKLWSIQLGECVVVEINSSCYPITVSSKFGYLEYTEDGKVYEGEVSPSLFYAKPFDKLPPAPVRQYPVDTLVEVMCDDTFKRYLKEVTEEGYARVFNYGASSKTTSGSTSVYRNWRVIE